MRYKQMQCGVLLALTFALSARVVLGNTVQGADPDTESLFQYRKARKLEGGDFSSSGDAVSLKSTNLLWRDQGIVSSIGLRARRRRTPGGDAAVDLVLTIVEDRKVRRKREKLRLRIETEEGDAIAERVIPYGSTIEVLNLPFQQWGERICVRFLGLRGCTKPVEALSQKPGLLAASDPMLWRASVLRPHRRENTALARFDPSREFIGATLEVYPPRREVILAVSVMLISIDGEVRMQKAFTVAKRFRPGITPALDVQLSPNDLPDGVYRLRLHVHDTVSGRSFSHEEPIELRRKTSDRSISFSSVSVQAR